MTKTPPRIPQRNRLRAARAREALRVHAVDMARGDAAEARNEMRHDLPACMVDLLSDLMHLADVKGVDFAGLLQRATGHHYSETRGEEARARE